MGPRSNQVPTSDHLRREEAQLIARVGFQDKIQPPIANRTQGVRREERQRIDLCGQLPSDGFARQQNKAQAGAGVFRQAVSDCKGCADGVRPGDLKTAAVGGSEDA